MKKRVLSLFMAFVLCLTLLPAPALAVTADTTEQNAAGAGGGVYADGEESKASEGGNVLLYANTPESGDTGIVLDGIDKNGKIGQGDELTDYCSYGGSEGDETWNAAAIYLIKSDVTIKGNLTVSPSVGEVRLVLGAGAKLTIEGALILGGGGEFYIYGVSNNGKNAGRLIIENPEGAGAAVRSTDAGTPTIHIFSGELEIHGNGQKLIDGAKLESTNHIHKGTLDDEVLSPAEWGVTSLEGGKLVIEYCTHDNDDQEYVADSGSSDTHHRYCTACGFTWASEECFTGGFLSGIRSIGEAGHTLKCICGREKTESHTEERGKTVPTLDGKGHVSKSCVCGYTSEKPEEHTYIESTNGSCDTCGFMPFMSASDGSMYHKDNYQEAFQKAAAGEVEWVQLEDKATDPTCAGVWTKSIEFNYSGEPVTLKMNNVKLSSSSEPTLTVSGGTLIIEDAATLEGADGIASNPSTSAVKVTGGSLTFKGIVTATGGSGISAAAPAIEVTGGKVTFGGEVTATGGLQGLAGTGNPMACKPAVYATSGELDFKGGLNLNGGLTVTGDATLTNKLSQGTFRVEYYYINSAGEPKEERITSPLAVSAVGSSVYNENVNNLLADNHIFVNLDSSDENNKYFSASYKSLSWNVTIEEHKHKFDADNGYECVCGVTCYHENGYTGGKCSVCGKPCPHALADQSPTDHKYYCNDCHMQMYARIQTDEYKWAHYTTLNDAMAAAENGQAIMLLDDVDNNGAYALLTGDAKTVTLDLNGKTITGGWIFAGIDRNRKNYTSTTLKIIGSGSIAASVNVGYTATLDLSGWTGVNSKITSVSPSKSGDDESTLIVGENAGTIGTLGISSWPTDSANEITYIKKIKLSGGSYDAISITMLSPTGASKSIPFSSMLAEGYAFQYTDKEGFVDYAAKAEYGNGGGNLYNVKVVPCPHAKIENGACAYCGKTGIAAMLGTKIYTESNLYEAFNDWQFKDNATLTLHQNCSLSGNIVWYTVYNGKLDLNGHTLTMVDKAGKGTSIEVSGGSSVTVVDNSASGGGQINGRVWISGGSLTLESGELTTLDAENSPDGAIKLRGGKVTSSVSGGSGTILVYRLLDDGYYLEGSALLAAFSGGPYEVKSANIAVSGKKSGEIAVGKNIVNIPVSLTLADAGTTTVTFDWYLVGTNKNDLSESKLASQIVAVKDGVAAYDPKTAGKSLEAGWDSLAKDKNYTLVCMVTGMADKNVSWQAALTGYTLHMLPPSLEDAEIIFGEGWQEKIFWPDANNNSVGKTEISSYLGAYVVKLGNIALTEGTDYTVSGNVAAAIGTHDLTITGKAPNYSGKKTVQWTVVAHKLAMLETKQSEKKYDGTDALPNGAFSEYFNSADGYGHIFLKEGTDYVVTDARFDTPDASDENKVYRYTVELKNPNYVFADGTRKQTAVYGESAHTAVSITKADARMPEAGALTILNNHADTYTVELPTLPVLTSPMEYGKVSYTIKGVFFDGQYSYYDAAKGEAGIENGKLILPVQAVATKTEGEVGAVAVTVSSTNIEDFDLIIKVYASNKIVPTGAPTLSKTTLTYGEPLSAITLSGTMRDEENGKDVTGTFAWDDTNTISGTGKQTMTWTFTPDDTAAYTTAKGSAEIEVVKATPTGAPKYTAITASGKTLADAGLTVEDGTFSVPGTVQWVDKDGNALPDDTVVEANTAYTWRFTPTDSGNYNILEGSVTLYSVSTGGGGSSTVTPPTTTETETTTDPDGTTTKTETKSDGSTVETVTKPDGSTTTTETKTETRPDGSTTTTETKSETNADGSKTETKSETTTAADGSKTETKSETKTEADGTKSESETKTETKPDGSTVETKSETSTAADGSKTESKTETTTAADGSKTETKSETKTEADGTKSETKSETKTDANGVTSGTETTQTTTPDGSTGTTTTTTENGNTKTEAEAKISEKAVEDAKKSGEAVKVPTEVKAGEDSNSAPTVKVELPKDAGETKIEIPVSDVNSGTVAVIVHEDGTEEIVKSSTTTENGLQLKVEGSATIKVVDNSKTFDDTQKHWSRDEVNFVASRELFNGVGGSSFGVNEPMTRGMVNTVLARLAGVDTTTDGGSKWYEAGTAWAKDNGISDGTNPTANVTREQLAAMLYRFAGSPEVSGELSFADADHVSGYAKDALLWAVQNGIMNGVGNNCVAPSANAERAQVAAMMARYLKNL